MVGFVGWKGAEGSCGRRKTAVMGRGGCTHQDELDLPSCVFLPSLRQSACSGKTDRR